MKFEQSPIFGVFCLYKHEQASNSSQPFHYQISGVKFKASQLILRKYVTCLSFAAYILAGTKNN